MRNCEAWQPTKFEHKPAVGWVASRQHVPMTSRLITDVVAKAYSEAIAANAAGRLLDIGCGRVPLYGMYRDLVSEVVCVDWPQSHHGSEHVDYFCDLNEMFDVERGGFGTVIATDVLEHLHAPENLFSLASRALGPSGKLILGVPFLYWIHEAPFDYHRYTRFALEKMARDAGLEVVTVTPYGGAPEALSDMAVKSLASHRGLCRVAYAVTRTALRLPAVKRLSKATSETMPLGYVLVAQKPGRDVRTSVDTENG